MITIYDLIIDILTTFSRASIQDASSALLNQTGVNNDFERIAIIKLRPYA